MAGITSKDFYYLEGMWAVCAKIGFTEEGKYFRVVSSFSER
jgi:hypothetical protein